MRNNSGASSWRRWRLGVAPCFTTVCWEFISNQFKSNRPPRPIQKQSFRSLRRRTTATCFRYSRHFAPGSNRRPNVYSTEVNMRFLRSSGAICVAPKERRTQEGDCRLLTFSSYRSQNPPPRFHLVHAAIPCPCLLPPLPDPPSASASGSCSRRQSLLDPAIRDKPHDRYQNVQRSRQPPLHQRKRDRHQIDDD